MILSAFSSHQINKAHRGKLNAFFVYLSIHLSFSLSIHLFIDTLFGQWTQKVWCPVEYRGNLHVCMSVHVSICLPPQPLGPVSLFGWIDGQTYTQIPPTFYRTSFSLSPLPCLHLEPTLKNNKAGQGKRWPCIASGQLVEASMIYNTIFLHQTPQGAFKNQN